MTDQKQTIVVLDILSKILLSIAALAITIFFGLQQLESSSGEEQQRLIELFDSNISQVGSEGSEGKTAVQICFYAATVLKAKYKLHEFEEILLSVVPELNVQKGNITIPAEIGEPNGSYLQGTDNFFILLGNENAAFKATKNKIFIPQQWFFDITNCYPSQKIVKLKNSQAYLTILEGANGCRINFKTASTLVKGINLFGNEAIVVPQYKSFWETTGITQ